MKFFQKRWVAWTLCACMILAALSIGHFKARHEAMEPGRETEAQAWAWDHYKAYEAYIRDEDELLTGKEQKALSVYNAASDYTYDTVCGLWVTNEEENPDQDLEREVRQQLHLDQRDLLLIVDAKGKNWSLFGGESLEPGPSHLLTLLSAEAETAKGAPGNRILSFYAGLEDWYEDHLEPITGADHTLQMVKRIIKTAGSVILVLLIVALAIAGLLIWLIVWLVRKYRGSGTAQKRVEGPKAQRASQRNRQANGPQYASRRYEEAQKKPPKEE